MIEKLHICLLTSARVFEIAYGGEERFTVLLAAWLARQGHEVTLMGSTFAGIKTKRLSKSEADYDPKRILPTEKKKHKVLYPPYFVYFLSRFVILLFWIVKILSISMKCPITLIHAQDTGFSALAAIISGKLLSIPVVLSSHGIRHKTLESSIHGRFNKILVKIEFRLDLFTIRNADGILVVNPSIGEYFKKIAIPKRTSFIPVPIQLKNFEFCQTNRVLMRRYLGIDEKTILIGYVGRFSPEKNLLTLLMSFRNVVLDNPSIKLVLVGTGPDEYQLKEYVVNNAISDKVIFAGVRYDIDKFLSGFDVFVLPSYTEGLSTSLLEAMASGRAIICSDIDANSRLVMHNQEAILVNPHCPDELTHAIQLLSRDDALRSRLGTNARAKASEYDETIVFPKIAQYYGFIYNEKKNEK
jgi:glycosyltransferase involved in cell wall biosynthesis